MAPIFLVQGAPTPGAYQPIGGELPMVTWLLRNRSSSLVDGEVHTDWTAKLVERFNVPDTLQVSGPIPQLRSLLEPSRGCVLEDDSGYRFSGTLTEFTKNGAGTATATFASDLIWLWGRICYPNPAVAWASQTTDYDTRSGAAETIALAFIEANAGPSALVDRRVFGLSLPASLGRGGLINVTARFDNLGQLVSDIFEAHDLRIRVVPDGSGGLVVEVGEVEDLSAWARFGTAEAGGPGVLAEDWAYTVKAPQATRALVGGQGELGARVLREVSDTVAEATWDQRVEVFVDQNNTTDTGELDAAGQREIDEGSSPIEISATVPDTPGMILGRDIPIGSVVSYDLDGDLITDRLRQVTTTIGPDGATRSGVVGSPTAGLTRDQRRFFELRKSLRKVQAR